jgi:hypothetical protein
LVKLNCKIIGVANDSKNEKRPEETVAHLGLKELLIVPKLNMRADFGTIYNDVYFSFNYPRLTSRPACPINGSSSLPRTTTAPVLIGLRLYTTIR